MFVGPSFRSWQCHCIPSRQQALFMVAIDCLREAKALLCTLLFAAGGCDGKIPNCLPIDAGWNGTRKFLEAPKAAIAILC
jgi:hypothetical protein